MNPLITIIVPVLSELPVLAATLAALPAAADLEIIMVDGGSRDGTWELAARFAHVQRLRAPRGRGSQMNAGAQAARGRLLVFLHADTSLEPAHLAALRRAAADPTFTAGAFELSLTPPRPALRFIARGAN
jgi:glycosyltransferase involved in cell wall biosynthesis